MRFALQVDIYEGDDKQPIVTHIFYGVTPDECVGVLEAHKQTDAFLAGCSAGHFRDFICRTVSFPVRDAATSFFALGELVRR